MTIMNRRYSGYEDFLKIREFLEECVSITGPKFYMNLGFFDFQWVSDFSSENYIGGLDEIFKDVHLWFEDNKLIGGFWPWGSEINIFIHPNKKSLFTEMVDVVVMGSDHKVAAFCSGQYDKKNKMASFEAVACSSDHRKKGLSKVMMLTALRNAQALGAESATIQTSWQKGHPAPNRLYESVGFELVGNLYFWEKRLGNV